MENHKISDDTDLSAVFVVIVLKPGDEVGTRGQTGRHQEMGSGLELT